MRAILLTAAVALASPALADEPRPTQRPERPRIAQPRGERPDPPRLVARLPELAEAVELLEAQCDIRKAHVRAAQISAKKAGLNRQMTEIRIKRNEAMELELAMAKLNELAAQTQVEMRQGELRETEVKLKYARLRLENAKSVRVRPDQVRPANPLRNREPAELKSRLEELSANAARCTELAERASLAVSVAKDNLENLRAAAKAGRVRAGTVESAEAVLADAQKKLEALLAERKARLAEIESLRGKLENQRK